MSQSTLNSFNGNIPAGGNFVGKKEVINGSISIVCVLKSTDDLTLNVYQSPEGFNFIKTNTYITNVALHGSQVRVQFYIEGIRGYIELVNNNATPANDVILRTIYTPNNHDGTLIQPTYVNVVNTTPAPISGVVEVTKIDQALPAGTNALGSVSVSNLPATQPVSGTVAVSSINSALPTGANAIGSVVASNLPLVTQAGTEGVRCKISATYVGDETTQDSSIVCYATQGPDFLKRLQIADPTDIPNNDLRELRTTDNSANISLASIDGKITACNTGAVVISSGTVGLSNSLTTQSIPDAVTIPAYVGPAFDMGDDSVVDVLLYASGTIVSGSIRLDYSINGGTWYPNNSTTYTISSADPHLTIIGLKTGSRYIRVSTGAVSTFRATSFTMTFSSKRS